MVADAHGRVVEQVAKLHHRAVLQLRVPGRALQSESVKKSRLHLEPDKSLQH